MQTTSPSGSIRLERSAPQQYLLRMADTCLILGQRLGEWCGHAPILEEDIALANIALDLIGQARALLTLAGKAQGLDEDQLAFLRYERDYFNVTLVELPRGDFAFTMLRISMVATLLELLWERLAESGDAELAAIAGKAVKEARYHREHAAGWVARLGDGTAESRRRSETALAELWRYTAEWFDADAVDDAALASGLGPRWADLRDPWLAALRQTLDAAGLAAPADTAFRSTGRHGLHSEHMGYILAEMQFLQRAYPGGPVVIVAEPSAVERAWDVLATVADPEIPILSLRDLGIVRDVRADDRGLEIVLTPTYSGCPATEVIAHDVLAAIAAAGLGPARVTLARAPAWTTDWISAEGRRKLLEYGIAPPGPAEQRGAAQPIRIVSRVACPQCGSADTERLSSFGATACKALYRCRACREPFEHFKPI